MLGMNAVLVGRREGARSNSHCVHYYIENEVAYPSEDAVTIATLPSNLLGAALDIVRSASDLQVTANRGLTFNSIV